mmetsp:Transcript_10320/g.24851  ORF Transcript_10320/g.24851 Transcript_10320/m.24851 type:complete len:117 (+) Transcript_10320:83-433(+)
MQTSLGCSASSLASILLLVTGLLYVVVQFSDSGSKASGSIVSMPMIGMSNSRGPWPKCVGMTGDDCTDYIETGNTGIHTTIIKPSDSDQQGKKFDEHRVRIYVDEDDIVDTIPRLG